MTVREIAAEYRLSEVTVRRRLADTGFQLKKITIETYGGIPYKREVRNYLVSDVRAVFGKKPK